MESDLKRSWVLLNLGRPGMHSNQRPDCLLTGGDGASNAVQSMRGISRAVREPGAEQSRCRSIG